MADENAGAAYTALISEQLTEERARKVSVETRGISVITTSGALITALFALAAWLRSTHSAALPGAARVALAAALAAFVLAAVFGLATNLPLRYLEPTPGGLARLVDERFWTAPVSIGQLRAAESRIAVLAAARKANRLKVVLLVTGAALELLAVALLAAGVGAVVYSS